jgi:hypothetical protein
VFEKPLTGRGAGLPSTSLGSGPRRATKIEGTSVFALKSPSGALQFLARSIDVLAAPPLKNLLRGWGLILDVKIRDDERVATLQ